MELELSPPTRKVYYYLLKNRSGATLRQIQEDLGFASTSAARYHIKKLVNAGLVEETFDGKYVVKKVVIDDDYLLLFNYILPKSVFFSSFFLTSFILILLFNGNIWRGYGFYSWDFVPHGFCEEVLQAK